LAKAAYTHIREQAPSGFYAYRRFTKERGGMTNAAIGFLALSGFLATSAVQAPTLADRNFVFNMLESERAQMQLAELALQRSTNPVVDGLAVQTVADGSRVDGRLTAIAYAQGIATPGRASASIVATLDRLGRSRGRPFDVAFARDERVADGRAIEMLKDEQTTDDAALHSYANRAIAAIRDDGRLASQDVSVL
jgi:predicted outer membrane protein